MAFGKLAALPSAFKADQQPDGQGDGETCD
jgi:hypothetical protein